MKTQLKFKGVIYDMDDVVVDSHPLHVAGWNLILKKYGHNFEEIPQSISAHFSGKRLKEISHEIVEYFKLKIDPETLVKTRRTYFLKLVKRELKTLPGLNSSLKFFKSNGFKIALATSAVKVYTDLVLAKFKLTDYFEVVITGEDVKKGKPNPETFLLAAEKLKLSPQDCVVIEDAKNGVKAAKTGGFKCIAIPSRSSLPQDLSKADVVIKSLEAINFDILEKL